ncbi:MAG: hypothetical protein S4CHLAM6_13270 [Chlamydiae bacterium]|nr:hypothetical protein [Chlamydiota bacterium]
MTRLSKQARRRNISPKRPRPAGPKTGPKKDSLELGYKERTNALTAADQSSQFFIGKIKTV